MVEGERGRRGR
jgi:hypothetical protein